MKDKVIDLEIDADGVYAEKKSVPVVKQKPKPRQRIKVEVQKPGMDQFFEGLDLGLTFIEGVASRAKRLMKLKG